MRSWLILSGGNGSTNLGDEAMWLAAAHVVREADGNSTIVTDASPGWRPPLADVDVLPYLHLSLRRGARVKELLGTGRVAELAERILSLPGRKGFALKAANATLRGRRGSTVVERWRKAIRGAQGVIFAGSGSMNDDYATHGILGWGLVTDLARQEGKPVAFVGQGIGPDVDEQYRSWLSDSLGYANLLTVRDEKSASVSSEIAVGSSPIVTDDWALLVDPTSADRQEAADIVGREIGDSPYVALSLHRRRPMDRVRLRRLSDFLVDLVAEADRRGLKVVLVPTMSAGGFANDIETFRRLVKTTGLASTVLTLSEQLSVGVCRAVLGGASAVVATRYHAMVFALAEGVPAWGLSADEYYNQKLSAAAATFGLSNNVSTLGAGGRSAAEILGRLRDSSPKPLSSLAKDAITSPLSSFIGSVLHPSAHNGDAHGR